MKTMGFIGCGNMGSAILSSVARHDLWKILAYDVRSEIAEALAERTGTQACSLHELLSASDIIVLGVKPQILPHLYGQLRSCSSTMWISMAAGVALETLADQLGSTEVARIMPNIGASVQKSVTAVAVHPEASEKLNPVVTQFAQCFGAVHPLDESLFSAFIGVSGSAIASALEYLHGIAMGGVHEGLSYVQSLALICDTVESATALLRESKRHPQELITQVCSPAGTTVKMMQVLYEHGFSGILMEAVEEAGQGALLMEERARNAQ